MSPAVRTRLSQLVRVVGLVVLVAVVARRVDVAAVRASWLGMSAVTGALVVCAFCSAMAVRIAKWGWQLRQLGLRFAPRELARNFLVAVLLGAVTPMRAGEL